VLATYNTTQGFAIGHALVYTVILLTGMLMTLVAMLLFVAKMMLEEAR
jgi:hypothetical protein